MCRNWPSSTTATSMPWSLILHMQIQPLPNPCHTENCPSNHWFRNQAVLHTSLTANHQKRFWHQGVCFRRQKLMLINWSPGKQESRKPRCQGSTPPWTRTTSRFLLNTCTTRKSQQKWSHQTFTKLTQTSPTKIEEKPRLPHKQVNMPWIRCRTRSLFGSTTARLRMTNNSFNLYLPTRRKGL